MKKSRALISILVAALLMLGMAVPAVAQVEPDEVTEDLAPGESITVTKTITTPEIPPKPDIYFMSDTTGSMGGVIAAVSGNASTIMAAIAAVQPDAQFGVGNYKDYPYDAYAFQHQLGITSDTAAVAANISAWAAGGGWDGSESQFYALTQISDPGVGWRAGSTKIVVWFGDAPAHDPVPMSFTSLSYNITEATVTAALVAAGIRVIAISANASGWYYPEVLDDDPTKSASDYPLPRDGTSGQATRIAAATGGVHLFAPTPEDAVAAVLEGLEALTTDVWGVVEADDGLTVTLDPAVHEDVPSGTSVNFTETITVAEGTWHCTTLTATVTFYANSYPEEGAVIGVQTISIHVSFTPVEIDIKPGSFPNSINPGGKGVIPVAILTTPDFDASTVDGDTARFGPDEAEPVHYALEDVDVDGDIDMILHFKTQETGIAEGDTEATLTAQTTGGTWIIGTDSVRTVPPKGKKGGK